MQLSILDNGQGFELPKKWLDFLREGHYGLAGIVERAETLGGMVVIQTGEKKGTLIQVTVPHQRVKPRMDEHAG